MPCLSKTLFDTISDYIANFALNFSIAFRNGLLPEPPKDVLRENALGETVLDTPKPVYTSKMAMLIKARENDDFMAFQEMAAGLVEGDPGAWSRVVNTDRALRTLALNGRVSSKYLNTEEESKEVEEQQAAMAQQQAAMQAAQGASEVARNMGAAPKQLQDSMAEGVPAE